MKYRKFGKLDWEVSVLGFGMMRLPTKGGESNIDLPEAKRMVRHAIDQGVNYIDTAWPYHGGESERATGEILKDGYREKVRLATKLPTWLVNSAKDFDRYFDAQRERLQTDRIDFYLLHTLRRNSWRKLKDFGVIYWAERKMAAGEIGHLGFSCHADTDSFIHIVNDYDNWTFAQIQYNYMDIDNQAGIAGLKHAAEKGLAVVIMEPLLGGGLAKSPESVDKFWALSDQERTPVDWALQWLWDQPEVTTVLSGMTEMQHVTENLVSADDAEVGSLSESEHEMIAKVRAARRGIDPVPCTACQYCMPCPYGVDIPGNFAIFNEYLLSGDEDVAREKYAALEEGSRASDCIECGTCEPKCPQEIAIISELERVHAKFG